MSFMYRLLLLKKRFIETLLRYSQKRIQLSITYYDITCWDRTSVNGVINQRSYTI